MNFQSETFYHIYNQGNNRQLIFFNRANYLYFLKKMSRLKDHCDLLAYCLMPNHFHWLIKTNKSNKIDEEPHPLICSIANLLSSYTQAINKQENRSGSLFRSKTKSKELDDPDYALICFVFSMFIRIHFVPVLLRIWKAGNSHLFVIMQVCDMGNFVTENWQ